jgi:hypothetical protein
MNAPKNQMYVAFKGSYNALTPVFASSKLYMYGTYFDLSNPDGFSRRYDKKDTTFLILDTKSFQSYALKGGYTTWASGMYYNAITKKWFKK